MSIHSGPADWWTNGTNAGRTHVATKGIVQDGLVLNLDAGVTASYPGTGTTWYDLSSIGGSATAFNNPTYASNESFNFDGASDYFQMTRADLNAGSFSYPNITIEIWIKPSSTGSTGNTGNNIFTIENTVEISIGNRLNGYSAVNYASNPWAWRGTDTDALVNDQWNQLIYVHATSGRWIYVNNVELFYSSDTGNLAAGTATYPYLTLMGRYTGTSSPAEGNLSIVRMYSRTLTLQEIQQNFNATRGRFGI